MRYRKLHEHSLTVGCNSFSPILLNPVSGKTLAAGFVGSVFNRTSPIRLKTEST